MKKLITIAASLLITQSLFALEFTTVKVHDRDVARCSSKADQIRNRAGAYRFKALNAKMTNSYNLEIGFELQFLKCIKTTSGFQMTSSFPYSEFRYEFRNNVAVSSISDVKIKANRDGQFKVLMNESLQNSSKMKLTFNKDISSILTVNELKTLDRQGEVKVSVDFFIVKSVKTSSPHLEFKRNMNFGSFRVHVKIEKKDGAIKAKLKK